MSDTESIAALPGGGERPGTELSLKKDAIGLPGVMTLVFERGDDGRVARLHGLGRTVLRLRRQPRRSSRARA
jgi:hypothetical protein